MINPKSTVYKESGLNLDNLSAEDAAVFLSANPKAMFRPILADDKKILIGFDSDAMKTLFHET